jgi:hypothetical protein
MPHALNVYQLMILSYLLDSRAGFAHTARMTWKLRIQYAGAGVAVECHAEPLPFGWSSYDNIIN